MHRRMSSAFTLALLLLGLSVGSVSAQTGPVLAYRSENAVVANTVRTTANVEASQPTMVQGGGAVAIVPAGLQDAVGRTISTITIADLNRATTTSAVSDPDSGTIPLTGGTVLGAMKASPQAGTGLTVSKLAVPAPFWFMVDKTRIPAGVTTNERVHVWIVDPVTGNQTEVPLPNWMFDVFTGTTLIVTDTPGLFAVTFG